MEKYSIYELSNGGIPFYVGITDNPEIRLCQHKGFYGQNIEMKVIIEHEGDYNSGREIEAFWIKEYISRGHKLDNRMTAFFTPTKYPEGQCQNCGKQLTKTPGKRAKTFCSTTCRSGFWQKQKRRKNGQSKKPGRPKKEPVISIDVAEIPTEVYNRPGMVVVKPSGKQVDAAIENDLIISKIASIKAEKIPPQRDTTMGRKSWALDQKKRIQELEKQLSK